MWDLDDYIEDEGPPLDAAQQSAEGILRQFFDNNRESVFFSRQLEVIHEHQFFHWITNRAIRTLIESGEVVAETRELAMGGEIKLIWHRGYRYYKRAATEVVKLVEEYAHPNIGAALGLHGEMMVLEGFARNRFTLLGREVNRLDDQLWTETNHDVDLVFERDGVRYGIEVKNTLGYMDYKELKVKVRLCLHLGLRPVFVVRMAPKHWIFEVAGQGGFILILKYQLYPWTHADLAKRVAATFTLPVDAPRALADGTMVRFLKYHEQNL
jgi:hypothetical protein